MFIDDMETEGIPERILQIMRALELDTMLDICRRIKQAGQITRTADYQLERLRHQSAFRSNYEKMIMKVLELSDEQLEKLYKDVIAQGYARDEAIYKATGAEWIPFEENAALQQLITSVMKQTHDTLVNITRTTGFVNPSTMQFSDANTYFINLLDKVHTEISTGVFSYDQALNKAVSEMASSGMRWVDYNNPGKKPWHNRIDVAARRAVMTGLVQVEGQIAEENAKKLHTEYFEVSAHATARPTHMVWQGRVYTKQQLIDICGLGTGPGLLGWNCYHHYDAFIPGISVRKYTDDQLEDMRKKALETKEWKGKRYTIYEATQRQRQLETAMRACNEKIAMLKEGGASRDSIAAQTIRRNDLYKEYRDFSKEFGLPEQINRVYTGINAKRFSGGMQTGSSGSIPVVSGGSSKVPLAETQTSSLQYDLPKNFEDVTAEYISHLSKGPGTVTMEPGYVQNSSHDDERNTANWLAGTFGGNITLKKESTVENEHTADSSWDITGEDHLWKYKRISSKSSISNQISEGITQILPNVGGLVLNVVKNENTGQALTDEKAIKLVTDKLKFYQKYEDIDVILKNGNRLIIVIRMHGQKKK